MWGAFWKMLGDGGAGQSVSCPRGTVRLQPGALVVFSEFLLAVLGGGKKH